jgi:hypothetical protein
MDKSDASFKLRQALAHALSLRRETSAAPKHLTSPVCLSGIFALSVKVIPADKSMTPSCVRSLRRSILAKHFWRMVKGRHANLKRTMMP